MNSHLSVKTCTTSTEDQAFDASSTPIGRRSGKRTLTLDEVRRHYPHVTEIRESELGFELDPPSPRQGRETLIIPKSFIIKDYDREQYHDPTQPWGDDLVETLLQDLQLDGFLVYAAYFRFGIYQYSQMQNRHYFLITNPSQAQHIQLLGIKDCSGQGLMMPPSSLEERLDAIAVGDPYSTYLPWTDEILRGWILNTAFNTKSVQKICNYQWAMRSSD